MILLGITTQTVHVTLWLLLVWVPQLLLTAGLGYIAAGFTVFYGCAADVGGFGESVVYVTPSFIRQRWFQKHGSFDILVESDDGDSRSYTY